MEYINAVRERAAFDGMEAQMRVSAAEIDLDFHVLRPIPVNQITRTTNDCGQNPGY